MKRALAAWVAVVLMGATGLGFGLSGSWSTEITFLPTVGLEETSLSLTYTVAGWDITSKSVLTGAGGYEAQLFQLQGALAFAEVAGLMVFDPLAAAYSRAYLKAELDLLGIELGAAWYHGTGWEEDDPGIGEELWLGWAHPDVAGRLGTPFSLSHLSYLGAYESAVVLDVGADPFHAQLVLVDRHQEFNDLTINAFGFHKVTGLMLGMPLCCGITFDAQLTFTKAGFQDFKVGLNELFTLMDLVTADVLITYGVDYKSVSTAWHTPALLVEGCVEIIADLGFPGLELELQGFGISCVIDDCHEIFFGTAFTLDQFEVWFEQGVLYEIEFSEGDIFWWAPPVDIEGPGVAVPTGWGLQSGWLPVQIAPEPPPSDPPPPPFGGGDPWDVWTLWHWLEFEVIELSFCGPGCCGADYEVGIAFYWADVYRVDLEALFQSFALELTQVYPTLFGLSRVAFEASVPLMASFTVETGLSHSLITGITELSFGWTFTF